MIELEKLIILLLQNADAVAFCTIDADGPLWHCLKRIIFSDFLLSKLYIELNKSSSTVMHRKKKTDYNFNWPLGSANSLHKAEFIIRQFLFSPPRYDMDAIRYMALILPADHFGFCMHSSYGGVYIDLVRKILNGGLEPIIVITDSFGFKSDTRPQFLQRMTARATNKPHWIARMDVDDIPVYNKQHPSYIRLVLAMHVLSATTGLIILYNKINDHFTAFNITNEANHYEMIAQNELLYFKKYRESIDAASMPIPEITFEEQEDPAFEACRNQNYQPLITYTNTILSKIKSVK